MIGKLRKTLEKGEETGAVSTDLSKTFDCIDHNLLIAKLNACGFEKQSIDFFYSYLYLTKLKQRTKAYRIYIYIYIYIYICDMLSFFALAL